MSHAKKAKKKSITRTSESISAEIEQFLASGGKILQIKQGVTGVPDKRKLPIQISLGGNR